MMKIVLAIFIVVSAAIVDVVIVVMSLAVRFTIPSGRFHSNGRLFSLRRLAGRGFYTGT